jgi:hypothetical protein
MRAEVGGVTADDEDPAVDTMRAEVCGATAADDDPAVNTMRAEDGGLSAIAKANTEVWNSKRAENSYRAMLKNYKEVAREHRSNCGTKFGLSEFVLRSGINTIEQKLEKLCPFYHRIGIKLSGNL